MKNQYLTLGDICDFQGGAQPPKDEWICEQKEGYVRMLQIRDFTGTNKNAVPEYVKISTKLKYCESDDILIGRYGASVGKILTGLSGAYNVALIKAIPNESVVCKQYLKIIFQSSPFQNLLQSVCCQRAAQAGFSKEDIVDFPVYLPALEEQKRRVSLLEKQFGVIEELEELVKQELEAVDDLFKTIKRNLLEPKDGWLNGSLKEICTFYNGKAHEKNIDTDGKYILVNSKFIASDGKVYKRTNSQLFPLFVDDVVMVMSDVPNGKALAKCFIVDKNQQYSLNQRICVFRNSKINVRLLYYMINRNEYLLSYNNGENQTNLRKGDIVGMPVCYPSSSKEAESIVEKLDTNSRLCSELKQRYEETLKEIDLLKKSLIKRSLSGEL